MLLSCSFQEDSADICKSPSLLPCLNFFECMKHGWRTSKQANEQTSKLFTQGLSHKRRNLKLFFIELNSGRLHVRIERLGWLVFHSLRTGRARECVLQVTLRGRCQRGRVHLFR